MKIIYLVTRHNKKTARIILDWGDDISPVTFRECDTLEDARDALKENNRERPGDWIIQEVALGDDVYPEAIDGESKGFWKTVNGMKISTKPLFGADFKKKTKRP